MSSLADSWHAILLSPGNTVVLLMCIVFTIHVQSVASERIRNETGVMALRIGSVAWNKTYYKTERKCVDFYNGTDWPSLFHYWPEADVEFDFCCTRDPTRFYSKIIYGINGPSWGGIKYHDLGLINKCLPSWKCFQDLFKEMMKHALVNIVCEFNDLSRFYKQRFWNDTVIKRGFLQSAIPSIFFAEIVVIAFVSVYWFSRRRRFTPLDKSKEIYRAATGNWRKAAGSMVLMDWTHLCLLAVIGNGLIEAMGRQEGMSAQSKTFYNYSRLYLVLSILVWCSSVLHQVAIYIAELEFSYRETSRSLSGTGAPGWASITHQTSGAVEVERDINLGNDWRWQPIGAQAGILFCLYGFLTYFSDDGTTGAVFGIIVSAAAPWSGLYASKVIVHTFPWILIRVYQNLIKGSPRALWTKARVTACLLQSGSRHVELNDLSARHEHDEGSAIKNL